MADTTDRIHIDEDDPKLQGIETNRKNEITDVTNTFNGMIEKTDAFTDQQIEAVKQNEQTQIKNQNDRTDFTLEKIEQEKELAEKDFQKEQSAAYVDFQKESNRFGVNAEKMAQNGFFSSGYSESSQVAMYNQYQNRVAVAREGLNKAVMNYNNQMTEARLQNNVLLAEIASKSLEDQLMIAMQGFQYKNELMGQLISQKNAVNQRYDSLWQSTYENMLEEARANESANQFYTAEENDKAAQAKADAQALCKSLAAIGKMPTEEQLAAAGYTVEDIQPFIEEYNNDKTEKEKEKDQTAANAKIEQLLSFGIRPKDDLIANSSWTPEEIDEILEKTTVAGSASDSEWTDFDGNPVDTEPESFDYSLLSDAFGSVSNYEDSAEALNKLGLIKAYVDGETGKFKLNFSAWALVDDGGTYSGKLNDNMKVKSPDGKIYSISELYDKFKDVMGTKAAKELLVKLQGYMKNQNPYTGGKDMPTTGALPPSFASNVKGNALIENDKITNAYHTTK